MIGYERWPLCAMPLVLVLLASWAAADTPDNVLSAGIRVEVRDGLLTLDVKDAAIGEVVRAIGERAGFETAISGSVDTQVTRSLAAVPVERALRRLLDDVPHVILHEAPAEGEARGRLIEVRLYGWSKQTTVVPPPPEAPPMVAEVAGPERELRIRAFRELSRERDPNDLAPLRRVLDTDPDPVIRGYAALTLGETGEIAALPALRTALADSVQSVRIHAIRALARFDSYEATRLLGSVLLDSPERRSRQMAAWALGHQGGGVAQSYLELALDDPDELVQQSAERAIAQIQHSANTPDPP